MNRIAVAALVLGLAGLAAGCARGPASGLVPADDREFASAFREPVGRGTAPRVDALFAPDAQCAVAWLGSGAFWNGDVELTLLDSSGVLLDLHTPAPAGPHADLPAARRRDAHIAVRAFMPWTGVAADTAGWLRLEIRAAHPGAGLDLAVRSGGGAAYPLHPHAPPGERFGYAVHEDRLLRDGRTVAIVAAASGAAATITPLPAAADSVPAQLRQALVHLAAGATGATWDVWIAPVGGAAANASPPDRQLAFAASLARTTAAWQAGIARGAAITHPDSRVSGALLSAHRLLVGNRERRNGATHFLGSPFQYRDLYLRDGARVVHALALLGRTDLAGQALTSLYEFQWPGGAFLSQRGQLDGTGQALWALGSYAALGGDPALVDRLVGPALRGARWIALQRASATLRGGPAAGLLPYADPRDNELTRGHLFGNDAWAIAGLEALAPLVRARGRAATADTLAAEISAYRVRLLDAWDAAARRQGRALPPVLEGGGRDWGNLSAAYPCGVLAADDIRVVALDRFLRAYHTCDGLLTYGPSDSIHHYLGFDRTQAALRRGDRAAFRADLEAILDHAQPDGSGFEFASRDGRCGENLPPHGTFAAMFVDLVRSSIVYERGDSLVLFAGAPANLAADAGAGLVVRALPTRFGALDLAARLATDGVGAVIEATLPAPAKVAWPPPARVRAVIDGNGTPLPVTDGRFTLPAGRATWRLEFEPAAGGEEGR